ncbi:hypothetical protein OS493_033998 [Desmophyllum pertusum]|uniref:G-protein coupled receptors family 2 profile 2 domain-containing protein n=1 Tax=Desmophyllum pertusum TaxID=174260 RepID=A0A9X0CUJ5_9CNID|nr:hypothetical protein OS493_033998 [Desmophyllum pertusum]
MRLDATEANTGPDTKIKRLCRSYSNAIKVFDDDRKTPILHFKNPHCALLTNPNVLVNKSVECYGGLRVFPRLSWTLFVFSKLHKKGHIPYGEITVRVKFNCQINEVYDPFQKRCLPVHSGPSNSNNTSTTDQCRGPRFPPNEFVVLSNNSVLIIPHSKVYNNDSYILVNQALILCINVSRNFTSRNGPKKITPAETAEKPPSHALALRVLTYVGFSLSIIALLFLLVTYFLFAELRTYPVCAVMGALLHYFILAVFLWMSVIAHNTQKTFSTLNVDLHNPVVIAERKKSYIRHSLFSWGFPLVIVGICVALQLTNTGNVGYGNEDGCHLSLPARTYAVAVPVAMTLVFNIVALIRTAVAIKQQLGQANVAAAANQTRLPVIVLKMTVVVGISWILGFVMAFYPTPYLEYPFIIINSCQGVLICISFVFKKHVFTLYKRRFMVAPQPEPATNGAEQQAWSSPEPATNTAEQQVGSSQDP